MLCSACSWLIIFLVRGDAQSQPAPRHLEKVVYDTDRNRLLLFGGVELQNEKWIEPSSVHEWDGNKWTQYQVAGPIGRRAGALVYNQSTRETFLFGGVSTGKVQPDSVLLDIWKWNGKKWQRVNTTCPVKEPEAIYDAVNKRILVYGDANNKKLVDYSLPAEFELWAYKNGSWRKLSAGGPNITGSRKICFDEARNKLIVPVFNENKLTVWEWSDGPGWTKTEFEKNCPGYRTRFSFAYHPVEKVMYLFGGLSAERKELGDFWKWDGRQWTTIDFTGGPSMRNSALLVFGNNELLLYGGNTPKSPPGKGSKLSNELWRWQNGRWIQYDFAGADSFKYSPSFSAIIVKDVDTSAAWYQAVFGMKIKNRINDTERGFRVVIMEHPSFVLELIENKSWPDQKQLLSGKPEGTRIQGFFKIGFSVADLDRCLEHLASLNIVPARIYTDAETKKRNFLIDDPDKNLIQFFE